MNIPPLGTSAGRELLIFFGEAVSNQDSAVTETWTGIVMPNEAPISFGNAGGTLFDLGRVFAYR